METANVFSRQEAAVAADGTEATLAINLMGLYKGLKGTKRVSACRLPGFNR